MKNYKYEVNGIALTDYCKQIGISYNTVYNKMLDGLSIEDAVKHAHKVKDHFSHRRSKVNGTSIIEFFETNYKHPITAYLRYSRLKTQGYSREEIFNKIKKYKE